jgi:hypothetical protein
METRKLDLDIPESMKERRQFKLNLPSQSKISALLAKTFHDRAKFAHRDESLRTC